jgi:hypothetical protein
MSLNRAMVIGNLGHDPRNPLVAVRAADCEFLGRYG